MYMKLEKKNVFRIKVKKCCASCAFKDLTRAVSARWCEKHGKNVKACEVCPKWRMNRQLKMAGFARGKVKRQEYLTYLASTREDEDLARQNGLTIEPKSIEQIRSEFEKEYGSIYINI